MKMNPKYPLGVLIALLCFSFSNVSCYSDATDSEVVDLSLEGESVKVGSYIHFL